MAIEQQKLSDKEIKEQVKEFSDKNMDILSVQNKDPNFTYRWVNTHKQNLEMKKVRGWEVVNDKNIKSFTSSTDSSHTLGDVVLCKMPKAKYEKMMRDRRELGEARRKAVKSNFRAEAENLGIKTFDER